MSAVTGGHRPPLQFKLGHCRTGSNFSCGQTAKYEKEVLGVGATLPRLQIQHELTENTEDRMRLRSLRWLLFKTRSAARSSPTAPEAGAFPSLLTQSFRLWLLYSVEFDARPHLYPP